MAMYILMRCEVSGIKGSYPTCAKIGITGKDSSGNVYEYLNAKYDVSNNTPNGTYSGDLPVLGDLSEVSICEVTLYDADDNILGTGTATANYIRA